jgi:nucleotide-binding universal stress UspA family protein
MNVILAPVDFSDASLNAVSFAAELSRRSSARLVIINIFQKEKGEDEVRNKMKSLEAGLNKSFDSDLKCESVIAQGNLITALKIIIEDQRPDIIVMGTKGASGLKKLLIGSNTVKVISETSVPVLVIPEVARFKNFFLKGKNRIVLATDLDSLNNEGALDILKEIALLIVEPKLRVLSVRSKEAELTDEKRKERDFLLSVFNPEIESERVTVFSESVIGGIDFYLSQRNTDTGLLAMIARDSGRHIQKHFTRKMASQTHLPLLVLHDANIYIKSKS